MSTTSNFGFLQSEWPELFAEAVRAERSAAGDPRVSCFYSRRALELAVGWLYEAEGSLKQPYRDELAARINEPTMRQLVGAGLVAKMDVIRRQGNIAVHRKTPVAANDAVKVVAELFQIMFWIARNYALQPEHAPADGLTFDPALIPKPIPAEVRRKKQAEIQQMAAEFEQQRKELAELRSKDKQRDAELAALRAEYQAAKAVNATIPDRHDWTESQTRINRIDVLLKEAGWALDGKDDREYTVQMPDGGTGRIDYVLWDDDGKPLAVVEAKRALTSAQAGQHQAKLYADALEQQHGQRPVIFCTNGYDTYLWDDTFYPAREVSGFYTKDQLRLLIQRRAGRQALGGVKINEEIVNRHYQHRAIRRIGEHFESDKQRQALLVMATGTGKTRTVIALVDQLIRAGWVKRVLFLADRQVLVNQAVNAFKAHLPGMPVVNLVTEKNTDARVYVSTYPTMLNLVNELDDSEERRFGPGYFDLVIVDEAHRSVYQKYRAIFDHFDSLLVGLTATPKDEIDRNTYRLFGLEDGVPTDSYDLDQAVTEGYLVPPRAVNIATKFHLQGISYDSLSEQEKEEWELLEWDDDSGIPDQIAVDDLNRWLFNEDTVDKWLQALMQFGAKTDDGERLGKTIIFARNQKHAELIVKRFNALFPEYKGEHTQLITNQVSHAQSLIDTFEKPDSALRIAVSVDMLDTGLDVPAVVNLVFAKLVRSKTKYWQMIGRGTRLCPNLFGPNQDKSGFLVFDLCQNIEYFNQDIPATEGRVQKSLSERLFTARADLLRDLDELQQPGQRPAEIPDKEPESTLDLRWQLAERLQVEVANMNPQNVEVRQKLRYVDEFSEPSSWDIVTPAVRIRVDELAALPTEYKDNDHTPQAKRFDYLTVRLQLAHLTADPQYVKLKEQVQEIASALLDPVLQTIAAIRQRYEFIEDVAGESWWEDVTLPMLETMRRRLRGLVKNIEAKGPRNPLFTDFTDELDLDAIAITEIKGLPGSGKGMARFQSKVRTYLRSHEDELAVQKILRNKQITTADLSELEKIFLDNGFGTEADIEQAKAEHGGLGLFLRGLTGLDRETAAAAFDEFQAGKNLTANQLHFLNLLIDVIAENGIVDVGALWKPPFRSLAPTGPEALFSTDEVHAMVSVLKTLRTTAIPSDAEEPDRIAT
ncbi:DEAD/DEAH box helicase family protein [Nocardia veterana]|uniref:DEAD/DEAH box helicase family protein n=1 Tax=Nocardia veterana TaxID=132249 RepID=A0A7X6RKW1_9NOCA|nr:DEAD/DEAH box helicase family protein [Nocardia veterana]NKY89782.1 DEAD/DEAH box helicase family protein [Nocardia veterana]